MTTLHNNKRQHLLASALLCSLSLGAQASDHLDTPTVIADPRVDIGDVYAWTSTNGQQLNLVMTIVGHSYSDRAEYLFHIDSGKRLGATTHSTTIGCRFASATSAHCWTSEARTASTANASSAANTAVSAGTTSPADTVDGDLSQTSGRLSRHGHMRAYAGVRDDPFFNNVKGTRAAYNVAAAALKAGAATDDAGCPALDSATSRNILDQWRQTSGGPGKDFLEGWTPAAIVIAVDLGLVAQGGPLLAVWGATVVAGKQIDRAGRPLTGNALLGTVGSNDAADAMKEAYNAAQPKDWPSFVPEIQKGLALYDAFDGHCGNQLLADKTATGPARYKALATLLADDRLWVNSSSSTCTQPYAVERASAATTNDTTSDTTLAQDCGGRTPGYDASNAYRSLLVDATLNSVDDGVHRKVHEPSSSVFPFLADPSSSAANK